MNGAFGAGLRLLGSSLHEAGVRQRRSSDEWAAYVVGETAVDPRACGKMMNIRERL